MKNLYVSLEISYLCQFSTSFNNLTRKNNAKNNHSLLESFTEKLIHALAHLMALHSNIFMLNSWFDISPNKWHQKWRHKKLRSIVKKAQMTTSLYQSVYFWQLGCRDFISYCFGLAKFKLNSLNLIFSRVFLHWIRPWKNLWISKYILPLGMPVFSNQTIAQFICDTYKDILILILVLIV